MSEPGFWAVGVDGEDTYIYYKDLDKETLKGLIQPVGGFVFPANSFTALPLPQVPFYVKDLLPRRGKALLYAPTKAGKSFLCVQLARCIGIGEPFLGLPTKKGKVLYIQFELGEEILQGRLKSSGKDYDNVFVGTSFSIKLDSKPGQRQVVRAIEAVEPNVLIIDPLYKTISGDENEADDMLEILDWLDETIEIYDCSVFMTHHSGKDISKRGRGSSVLEDWVDSYIRMLPYNKAGEPLRVKINTMFLRHAPLWESPISAELQDDFEFANIGGELTIKQQIERLIFEADGEVDTKKIFEAEIGTNTSVYSALKKLIEEGKIEKTGHGKYRRVMP